MNDAQELSRGWYFPVSLIRLYEEGIVNASELMLLGKINALCDPRKGCWATNRWLAKWWGKHVVHGSRSISKFAELGSLKLILKDGNRRIIKVKYNGDEMFTPRTKMFRGVNKNVQGGEQKCSGLHTYTNYINERTHDARRGRRAGRGTIFPEERLDDPPAKLAQLFVEFTVSKNLHKGRKGSTITGWKRHIVQAWEEECRKLVQNMGGDWRKVRRVLKWYFEHWKDRYIPRCNTMKTFCERFGDLHSEYLRRLEEGKTEEQPEVEIKHLKSGAIKTTTYHPDGQIVIKIRKGNSETTKIINSGE